MNWWKRSLYDTCSLITLDKLLLERPALSRHFPRSILALEVSLSPDQVGTNTLERMSERVTKYPLPDRAVLALIFSRVRLTPALTTADSLIYATAVHHRLSVVTGDHQLARAIRDADLTAANMSLILRELVHSGKLSISGCERLMVALANRGSFILGTPAPTWNDLLNHRFPDR